MLSVISHFTNEAEHPELAASASAGPVQLVGREDIVAGTDCGFAQGLFYRRVHPSMMWAKFEPWSKGRGSLVVNFGPKTAVPPPWPDGAV